MTTDAPESIGATAEVPDRRAGWSARLLKRLRASSELRVPVREAAVSPRRPGMAEGVPGTARRRFPLGRLACLGLVLAAVAGGQDPLSIPLSESGELQPSPGVRLLNVDIIHTLAGTGADGDGGDGGPALEARFSFPRGVAADSAGTVYVADTRNHRIRRIDPSGNVSTLAGTGEDGDGGDGGAASEAQLCLPAGVAVDAAGNVYVADTWNHRIRKIDPSGLISTLAGTGNRGYAGDGGPASQAWLAYPMEVATDAAGNVYVADSGNHRVRRINSSGVISTFAGTGIQGHSGDGGPSSRAQLSQPTGVAADAVGNVYVADSLNHRIRKVDPSGVISSHAGNGGRGDEGDGGPASEAHIAYPVSVAADSAGNVYVTAHVLETGNNRVRRIDASGGVSAFAGVPGEGYGGDGSPAPEARLAYPMGIDADDAGNVYIADARNARVRVVRSGFKIDVRLGASGESLALLVAEEGALTLGGRPVRSGDEVTAANGNSYSLTAGTDGGVVATFLPETQRVSLAGGEVSLTRDEDGIWRIGDDPVENGHRHLHQGTEYILELADGSWGLARYTVETVAGTTHVAAEGIPATSAVLHAPTDVVLDPAGNVYFVEWRGHRVRKILASGVITTLAGTGDWGFSGDGGPAAQAQLNHPFAIASDSDGNVYVTERDGHRLRKIDASGVITTVAGTGDWGDERDGGPASDAALARPLGVASDSEGNVYVSSWNKIRKIDQSGIITTFAGTGQRGSIGDGGLAVTARLADPHGISFDASGNLYVAGWDSNRVRRIETTGVITNFAGTGELGYSGDGGSATEARLHHPLGIAADSAGNVYVTEDGGGRVRKIDAGGLITTMAGTGDSGFGGDGGPATDSRVNPFGIAAGTDGSLYIAEPWNRRIRRIDESGVITTFAGSGYPERVDGLASEAQLEAPRGVAVHASGDLIFAEWGRLWKLNTAGEVARVNLTAAEGDPDLQGIEDIALDTAGNLYVAEQGGRRISRINATGVMSRFAGTGERGTSGDGGPASEARLDAPVAVAVDSLGNVYVADRNAHRVRKIDPAGTISTFAGTGERGTSGDGGPASEARLEHPRGVAVDSLGNVYIADQGGDRIRRVDGSGAISMFADPGIKIAQGSIATDTTGNVYVGGNRRILRIDTDGAMSTVAGTGEDGYNGDGGPARSARFSVSGLSVDQSGDVWFADRISRRIRVLRRQLY